jgi:hypothetical protein
MGESWGGDKCRKHFSFLPALESHHSFTYSPFVSPDVKPVNLGRISVDEHRNLTKPVNEP